MTFVFLEGIYQDKSTYGISGSTLTFATAPQSGYNVEVMVLGAISASTNALYTDTFTGDGTETAYTLGITPVDLNAIEVYLNGLYQNVATLTLAANVVTFATAPPSGVIIEIRSVGFLNSGGTLAPATLTGGTGISVVTNSPNNFTISNTLIDVSVSFNAPTGQSLTYTTPGSSTGQAGSIFPTTTFTVTKANNTLSGTAVITGLPAGITSTQSYNNTNPNNILTITLSGVYPSTNSVGTNLVISNLTVVQDLVVTSLIVAGGGGGGLHSGGGGGAGGLLYYGSETPKTPNGPATVLSVSTNYIVTVGAGGAGSGGPQGAVNGNGYDGLNSVFSTFTAVGGGGGGGNNNSTYGSGRSGGSGGGGMRAYAFGTGTTGQGNDGSNWNQAGAQYPGGGGGGAGAAGGVVSSTQAGNGGVGLQYSITGNATYYAGGGGGNLQNGALTVPPQGSGGLGGGGEGRNSGTGDSGTPNTGGGGGGNQHSTTGGGAGGSGIVILRYPSSFTISGLSGTTTTVGTDSVTTFTTGTGNIQFN